MSGDAHVQFCEQRRGRFLTLTLRIILGDNVNDLQQLSQIIEKHLFKLLNLVVHPQKTIISKYTSGIDFLGYVHFPDYILLRHSSKKRMIKKLKHRRSSYLKTGDGYKMHQSVQSYAGMLLHANEYQCANILKNAFSPKSTFYKLDEGF